MKRRNFLQLSTLGALPAALGLGRSALAQTQNAIALGCPVPMSGAFAANGKFSELGMRLAVQQYGQVLGRPLTHAVLDTEGRPATAVRRVQESAQQGTRFFAGGILSSAALAMGKEAERAGGIFITTAGADEITGKDCNRATFRWSTPTFGAIEQTVRPLIDAMPQAKRWYTITPQYVFGDGLLSAAKAIFQEKGIEHVGNSYHSLTEKEFSGYLTNALAARPDVLLLLNFGAQASDALRQAASFGMKRNTTILMAWASGLEQFEALGADLCEGVYFGAQYWHTLNAPLNRELVKRCQDVLGINPNYSLASMYMCSKLLIDAIAKAGTTDTAAVVAALESMQYQGVTGEEIMRKADHQVLKNYHLLKGKPKAQMKDKDDFVDVLSAGKSYLEPAQAGCTMA